MKIFYEAHSNGSTSKRPGQIILPTSYLAHVKDLVRAAYPNNSYKSKYNHVIFSAEDNNIRDGSIIKNFPRVGFEVFEQDNKLLFIIPVPQLQREDNEYMQYAVPHSDGHTGAKVYGFFLKFERKLDSDHFDEAEFIKVIEFLAPGTYDKCIVSDDGYWVFVYDHRVSNKYKKWFQTLLDATDQDFGEARESIPDVVSWREFVESLRNTIY